MAKKLFHITKEIKMPINDSDVRGKFFELHTKIRNNITAQGLDENDYYIKP